MLKTEEILPVLILDRVKSIIDINNPYVLTRIRFPSRINWIVVESLRDNRMFPL